MRRVMGYADRSDLQQIVAQNKGDNYQLATLVENFVASELFQKR